VVGAFFLQRLQARRIKELTVSRANDTRAVLSGPVAGGVFYWFAVLFVFLFLHLELNAMFVFFDPLRLPVLTVLWCAMAVFFLWHYLHDPGARPAGARAVLVCGVYVFLAASVLKLLTIDASAWKLGERFIYDMEYSLFYAGVRFFDYGVILAFLFGAWSLLVGRNLDRRMGLIFGYGGLLLLFFYSTLELNSLLYWKLREFQGGGISVLWSLFAIAFIAGGIWKDVPPLRYLGLGLFAVVTAKVFFVDLHDMEMIFRVVAFLVVGVVLLLGSFAYLYANKKFTRQTPGEKNED